MAFKIALGRKNLFLFIASTAVLLYGLYLTFDGARFYFHDAPPVDLGEALTPNEEALAKVVDGDYVTIRGIRSIQGGVMEEGFSKKKRILYYFLGSPRFVVSEPMAKEEEKNAGGMRVRVTGRIYRFETSGGAARARNFFEKRYELTMAKDGFFIRAGENPRTDTGAVALFSALLVLLLVNLSLALKTFRRREEAPEENDDIGGDDDSDDTGEEP